MQPWIEYLLLNASASADYISWAKTLEKKFMKQAIDSLALNKLNDAEQAAYRVKVYEDLRKQIEKYARERNAQIAFDENES